MTESPSVSSPCHDQPIPYGLSSEVRDAALPLRDELVQAEWKFRSIQSALGFVYFRVPGADLLRASPGQECPNSERWGFLRLSIRF